MKARAVKSFPVGPDWMYEPKLDGFRCLVFRDHENIFLQSKAGKSLISGFPEISAAFQALNPKRFVLDGELVLPTQDGFSFDGLVNRLRIGSARLALEVRDSPAIYIVFDILANSENLLGSPFHLRRKTLERLFENSVPRSLPLYLSASTENLKEVEKWVGHIGQQLDGIRRAFQTGGLRGLLLNFGLLFGLHPRIPANEGFPELVIEHLGAHLK